MNCSLKVLTNQKLILMVNQEPNVTKTGRYSISETCKLLGIHRHTLRSYTNRGCIHCAFRRSTTRKYYSGNEILRFWRAQL